MIDPKALPRMTTRLALLLLAIVLAAPATSAQTQPPTEPPAQPTQPSAQPPPRGTPTRAFFSLSGGMQSQSREFQTRSTFSLYEETASHEGTTEISGGGIFDIGGGIRLWRQLGVGIGFSRVEDSDDITISARIPNPLFFDRPRNATAEARGLNHSEQTIHLQILWIQPIVNRVDVTLFAGPTFFSVKQDLVTGLTVTEGAPPFSTVTISSLNVVEQEERSVGFHIGADVGVFATHNLGGGFFLRYTGGDVTLTPPGGGEVGLSVGGFEVGGGVRVRF